MGPSRMQGMRFAWKKFAIGAFCIISVVYFFGPREPRNLAWGNKTDVGECEQR